MRHTHRTLVISCTLLVVLLLFAGCGAGGKELPGGQTAADVETQAKEALDLLNARDYAALSALFVAGDVTEETWADSMDPVLDQLGTFESYKSVQVEPYTDKNTGIAYAVALVECQYANGKVVYSLSFDADGGLVGLFIVG